MVPDYDKSYSAKLLLVCESFGMTFELVRANMKNRLTKISWILVLMGLTPVSVFGSNLSKSRQLADSIERQWQAADSGGQLNSLDGYLSYAALNNPGLKAAFYRWRASLERVAPAGSLTDPQFSFSYFIENVETRVGPQNYKLALRQSFPWFGTLGAASDAAFSRSEVEYQRFVREKLNLFFRVKLAYYNYYLLERKIQITQDNLALLSAWEGILTARFEVSAADQPDLSKVQVELARLEDDLRSLEAMRSPVKAELLASMGVSDLPDLPAPGPIQISGAPAEFEDLWNELLANNPDLSGLRKTLEANQAHLRLAKKSFLPGITLGLGYTSTGPAMNPAIEDSGKDPWEISVGVSIPIWFGRNKATVSSARAALKQTEYELDDVRNALMARLTNLIYEYNDACRRVELYSTGLLPKAEESLNTIYVSYQSGKTDFLNLLDTQRQLIAFQLEYETALTTAAIKLAEIETLTGS